MSKLTDAGFSLEEIEAMRKVNYFGANYGSPEKGLWLSATCASVRGFKFERNENFIPNADDDYNSYDERTDSYDEDDPFVVVGNKSVMHITLAVAKLLFPGAMDSEDEMRWMEYYTNRSVGEIRDAWMKVLSEHDQEMSQPKKE